MKTSSCKAKGRNLQNKVREEFLSIFPTLEEDVRPALMGESGRDIKLSPRAEQFIPFDIECKNVESLNIWSALEQCKGNTKEKRIPLLIFKRNHEEVHCCLRFEDFMKLIYGDKYGKKETGTGVERFTDCNPK